jgi:hypothetical protein
MHQRHGQAISQDFRRGTGLELVAACRLAGRSGRQSLRPLPRSRDRPPAAGGRPAARGASNPPGDSPPGTGAGSRHHVQSLRVARRNLVIMRPAVISAMSTNGIGVAIAGINAFARGS